MCEREGEKKVSVGEKLSDSRLGGNQNTTTTSGSISIHTFPGLVPARQQARQGLHRAIVGF